MPRVAPVAELAMEAQVGILELARRIAPLYERALASGDYAVMAETKALAQTLKVARLQAKRIAGFAERIECADGLWEPGHGRAA